MLDTLLEIGSKLRLSPDGLRHHRYIKKAPIGDDRTPISYWVVPVKPDYSFDFSERRPLKNETRINSLFYLNFKNGEADSTKPYVFGDVFRLHTSKAKRDGAIETSETGNFLLGDPKKSSWMGQNSFLRYKDGFAVADDKTKKLVPANPLLTDGILKFRASFRSQLSQIVEFLEANPLAYIHFDFCGKGWWELADKKAIENILLENFLAKTEEGYVFQAFIYKTIMSGGTGTPHFSSANDHKVRVFESEERVLDLLYALNYAKRAKVRERDTKVIVLPRGKYLEAKQLERFFERGGLGLEEKDEEQLERESEANAPKATKATFEIPSNGFDPMFGMLSGDEEKEDFLQFDFVFARDGGTKPDIDLIEIAGIHRSKLYDVANHVRTVSDEVQAERNAFFDEISAYFAAKSKNKGVDGNEAKAIAKVKRPPIFLTRAFLSILGDQTTAKKKYQSHLLKVLPQIYTATYFNDPVLLPAFIEKIEFNIRNGEAANFNFLKWDLYFLLRIQNGAEDRVMNITDSHSYNIGLLLGRMARGLRPKINSFDKNYAGLISRRISTLPDLMRLHNEINGKLVMHNRADLSFTVSHQLSDALKKFEDSGQKYNKDECIFGFYESYFTPKVPKVDEDPEVVDSESTTAA